MIAFYVGLLLGVASTLALAAPWVLIGTFDRISDRDAGITRAGWNEDRWRFTAEDAENWRRARILAGI